MISLESFNPVYRYNRFRLKMAVKHPGVFGRVSDVCAIEDQEVPPSVRDTLKELGEAEAIAMSTLKFVRGASQQRTRLSKVAEYCAEQFEGDFAEIGAFKGETTAMLGQIAEKFGRRVVVVDPWEIGTQNCDGEEYEAFKANTAPISHVIDVLRLSSLSEEVKQELAQRQLSFAWVDGLHTYDACLSDILAVSHCRGIVAVDDLGVMFVREEPIGDSLIDLSSRNNRYDEALRSAFRRAAFLTNRKPIHHPFCREGYLLPNR